MTKYFAWPAAAILALSVQACSGLTSVEVGSDEDTALGLVYFLPTTRIPLTVSVNKTTDQIVVAATPPEFIADERYRYRLQSIYSPFHAETVDLKVTAAGLLTNANLTSEGRIAQTIVAAARSAALLIERATAFGGGETQIINISIDVAELASKKTALDELNATINAALRTALAGSTKPFLTKASAVQGRNILTISVKRLFPDTTNDADTVTDCSVGLCYRLPVYYVVTAEFFDGTIHQKGFAVPNGSRAYPAAVNRGVFTKWTDKVVLTDGMMFQYGYVTDGSEIEKAVSLPFDVVGGMIEGLTQRGALWNARSTLLESEVSLLEKQANVEDRRAALLAKESTIDTSGDRLFEFVAGEPSQKLSGAPLTGNRGSGNGGPSGSSTSGSSGTGG